MAISPGIPTSFVPKQPLQPVSRRPMSSGSNVFLLVSLIVAGIAVVSAGLVFAYDKYLDSRLATKQALLAEAQGNVDQNTIEDFIRLRDRLSSGKDLMNNHVELSQFFTQLETLTLQNVRFTDMKLTVAGDHTAKLQMNGMARNFNALAAQSNAFAGDKRIKRAIFSSIGLTDAKQVSFTLTADIDSRLIVESPEQAAVDTAPAPAPEAVTLPASTTATTSAPALKPVAPAPTTATTTVPKTTP